MRETKLLASYDRFYFLIQGAFINLESTLCELFVKLCLAHDRSVCQIVMWQQPSLLLCLGKGGVDGWVEAFETEKSVLA